MMFLRCQLSGRVKTTSQWTRPLKAAFRYRTKVQPQGAAQTVKPVWTLGEW